MKHVSVLKNEAIKLLDIKHDGVYLDLTLGRAGHSQEILKRLTIGKLYGFDLDQEAINESKVILDKISSHYQLINDNFLNFDQYVHTPVDAILMDLGVSSPQFDDAKRGFSYRLDAPLDMRMNLKQKLTAKEIVNEYSLKDITNLLRNYGEEKDAYQIALNIIKVREKKEIVTTGELVEIIKQSKSTKELNKKGHPAKQTFQALRIAVNDELNSLKLTLEKAFKALKPGGRLVVITFHSLEDRIVKNAFNSLTKTIGNREDDYQLPNKKSAQWMLLNKSVILPTEEEITNNPRSKSAKLRGIKKL